MKKIKMSIAAMLLLTVSFVYAQEKDKNGPHQYENGP